MSNKTPPLVIPVVVDASGVQQGLNNVNNRLRTGVAGGSAGGAGGGGFGSGGGASVAAAAVGAAVGAYGSSGSLSGNRYGSNFSPRTQATLNNLADRIDVRRSNSISRGMQGIQNYYTRAAEIANRGNYPFARGEIKGLGGKTPMAYSLNEQGKVWGARSEAFGRFYQRNKARLGTSISMGEIGSALKEARGPLLSILGAGYASKKIYDLANRIG